MKHKDQKQLIFNQQIYSKIHVMMTTDETTKLKFQLQASASNDKEFFDEITIVLNKHQNKYDILISFKNISSPRQPIKVPRVIMTALSAIVLLIYQNGM